jgi:microcystin-dependent protein
MSTPYVGEIRLFGFSRMPNGWQTCDGSLLSIAEYEVLFTLIGTTYGGDGQSTFAVPDLRGAVPLHWGNGPGLSSYVPGQRGGSEGVTLTTQQMPSHNHGLLATTAADTATAIGTNTLLGAIAGDTIYVTDTTGASGFATSPASTSPSGGNRPHDNLMPTLTVQYCISLFGVFPSQS